MNLLLLHQDQDWWPLTSRSSELNGDPNVVQAITELVNKSDGKDKLLATIQVLLTSAHAFMLQLDSLPQQNRHKQPVVHHSPLCETCQ
jgi:hypothetical protein